MCFSVDFASLGNCAEAAALPWHSSNASFCFVELHDLICFSGSKVQQGRAPMERRVQAARANKWVLALKNSTRLFACIQTTSCKSIPPWASPAGEAAPQTSESSEAMQTGARKNVLLLKRELQYSAWCLLHQFEESERKTVPSSLRRAFRC